VCFAGLQFQQATAAIPTAKDCPFLFYFLQK